MNNTLNIEIGKLVDDTIVQISLLGDGYLSSAYIAHGVMKKYVIRKTKAGVAGYEYPGDIARSYLISHKMFECAYMVNGVKSYGIITHGDDIYHVQQYVEGIIKSLNEYSEEDIVAVATKIALIHSIDMGYSIDETLYLRSLREVVVNHETILSLYEQSFGTDLYLKDMVIKSFNEYIKLCSIKQGRRCVMLHGDFWHNNIIFNGDTPYLIDFSRIPYGEAGIDVGHFLANIKIEFIVTGDSKYQRYYDLFLKTYIQLTNDYDIEKYLKLSQCFVISVCVSPKVQKFLQWDKDILEEVMKLV